MGMLHSRVKNILLCSNLLQWSLQLLMAGTNVPCVLQCICVGKHHSAQSFLDCDLCSGVLEDFHTPWVLLSNKVPSCVSGEGELPLGGVHPSCWLGPLTSPVYYQTHWRAGPNYLALILWVYCSAQTEKLSHAEVLASHEEQGGKPRKERRRSWDPCNVHVLNFKSLKREMWWPRLGPVTADAEPAHKTYRWCENRRMGWILDRDGSALFFPLDVL